MQDSLILRVVSLIGAALVAASMLGGIDRLATHEHAATALAEGRSTPALVAAARGTPAAARGVRVAASAPTASTL